MQFSAHATLARFGAFVAAVALFAGCGGGDSKENKDSVGGPSGAVTMPKTYKGQAGPDASVPAELGGPGFEKIAADSGWQTGSLSDEQFALIADRDAKKGGRLTFAENDFPATFRPFGKDAGTTTIQMIEGMVYEALITINPLNLKFLPVLATHWKVDPDGQTYYYRINPNARFSDGYPVTSQDVVATYRLRRDSTILDPFQNEFYNKFEEPVAVSKYIVKVRSKEKQWKNFYYFGASSVLPAHQLQGLAGGDFLKKYQYEMLVGSGPYVILPSEVEKQKSLTFTRVADWWQKDDPLNQGQYNFDKVKVLFIEDENQQYEQFRAGKLDFLHVRKAQDWHTKYEFEDVKSGKIQKRKIYTDDPQGISGFAFNTRRAPFNDPKVREAFIHLFNREELIPKLMYNEYIISDSYFPNSVYANPGNPKYRYDPQRAAQLLAEAGYTQRNAEGVLVKNGKPFEIELPIAKGSEHIMAPVQQWLRQAGIKMNIRIVDWAQSLKLMDERNFDLVYQAYAGIIFPNPEGTFHSKFADPLNTNNITGFKNPQADALIERELVTYDQDQRVQMIRQLDSIFMESKVWALGWYAPFQRIAYWNHLQAPDFYLGKISDWRGIVSTWWIDREAAQNKPGEVEVKFWPNYNKANPVVMSFTDTDDTAGSTGSKPALK